jgi:uncharacterized protein DUF4189
VRRLAHAAAAAIVLAALNGAHAQDAKAPMAPQTPAPWTEPPPSFGAIAFTADGSFATTWTQPTRDEAEEKVRDDCARFKRGDCQVVAFGPDVCAAIASFETRKGEKRTYSGGGLTPKVARRVALERCNGDKRAHKSCKLRTIVCGDGRQAP